MKLTIKKELLLDALNKVSKAISTKNLIPVLSGIKFDLKKKKLTLTASDNDITIQTTIESDKEEDFNVENEGSIIIQGKYILDIVRKLPDNYINIEVIDELKTKGEKLGDGLDQVVQYMDLKNKFIVKCPRLGKLALNVISYIYRIKKLSIA